MKKTSALLFAVLSAVSCIKDPDPAAFYPPQLTGTGTSVEGNAVIISCGISGSNHVKECGFMFGTDEEKLARSICTMGEDGKFSKVLEGLTFNVDYYYSAFIGNGRDEKSSETKHFKIQQRLPSISLSPVSERTSSAITVEYDVNESFSGDLIACGLCWDTEPEPTIESHNKTIDGSRYGSHKTEIRGLEVGTTWHIRAYAINAKGTAYSNDEEFFVPVSFEDEELSSYMLKKGDTDGDGFLSLEEAKNIRSIDICTDHMSSIKGLEYCTGLISIKLAGSGVESGRLGQIDLKPFHGLETLDLSNNMLTSIDLSGNSRLRTAALAENRLSSLRVPYLAELTRLDIHGNPVSVLNITSLPAIEELDMRGTSISGLNDVFKAARGVKRLYVGDILQDGDKVYLLSGLEVMDCSGSAISDINLRYSRSLKELSLIGCKSLTSLDISLNDRLTKLDCTGCSGLKTIYMNELQKIDGINSGADGRKPEGASVVYSAVVSDNAFEKYLTDTFDSNGDLFVSITEVENVEEVNIDNNIYSGISSVHGLEMFRSLKKLSVPWQQIASLDLSANTLLTDLTCDGNPLTGIDIRQCHELRTLYCQNTPLSTLDLSGCGNISSIYLYGSRFRHLDLTSATKLRILDCSSCRLEGDLDLSACPDLQSLDCSGNPGLTRILLNSNCASSVQITKDAHCIISH